MLASVCVFCGSNPGHDPALRAAASTLGFELGRRGIRLVYGGSHLGLMGAVADATLAAGGAVTGVMPQLLVEKEAAYGQLTDLRIVTNMHERKALMVDLAEGFIALPGAFGTFDELFECLTWGQLGIHRKPIVVWNVGGFYDSLLRFLDEVMASGLLRPQHRGLLREAANLEAVFTGLEEPLAELPGKWLPPELR